MTENAVPAVPVPGGIDPFLGSAALATAPEASQTPQEDQESPEQAPEASQASGSPEPLLKGTFAIYLTPEHAIVLAYRPAGTEETKQMVVPPFIMAIAAQKAGVTPEELVQQLREGF